MATDGRTGTAMTDLAALHKLHAWLSPSYPVGSFAYSHGLEQVIAEGIVCDADGLRGWLRDVLLHGSGRNDAILLVAAYRADGAALAEIAELAEALVASAERRTETMAQGAAFAATTAAVWPDDLPPMAFPVAVGAAARVHRLDLCQTLNLYLHAFVANLVSAAVRFMPLGQTEGQAVLASLFGDIEALADTALGLGLDDLGGIGIAADIAAMRHETLQPRIFRT